MEDIKNPNDGKLIHAPMEICGRNFERPMYPLTLNLCFYCQKNSSERQIFETATGRWYIQIILCPRCVELNKASQEAGRQVLRNHIFEQSL